MYIFQASATGLSLFQPLDSDLTSWALVTRASGLDTFAATPSSANLQTLVTDETGSGALVFASSPSFADGFNVISTAAGAAGVSFGIEHDSASPAANDVLFQYDVRGNDSLGNSDVVLQFQGVYEVVTSGSESAYWVWRTMRAGARTTRMAVGAGIQVGTPTVSGGDKGDGTINVKVGYYAQGNQIANNSGHLLLRSYTIATLPAATTAAQWIYVTDETGGAIPCFSDGTNWRRTTDRAIAA